MSTYRAWARLNFDGKREWGDIFPDGKVPIQSIATQHAKLEGIKDIESVFTVDWNTLADWQQQAVLEKLSKQSGAPKETVQKEILRVGLPLRRKHIQSCGTKQAEFFL
ncbi:MAG: hypothetical protein NWE99_02020 [Candidatus Bathyarchaeota archaeon]|nr:hypothetical protein [Candidatus Bathyarchaeota archaeon]